MNDRFFVQHLHDLFEILDDSGLCNAEIKLRKERLKQSVEAIRETENPMYYNKYNQRAHEIESIPFLKQFGIIEIAQDHRHDKGCDFAFNENIYIECVCSSPGQTDKNGLSNYMGEGIFDYKEKKRLINARFTSSLCDKVEFYYERVGNSILSGKPYIIFLSTGSLAYEWFEEKYGIALLDVLLGRGDISITIDTDTNQVVSSGYTHKEFLEKYNKELLDCNLFLNEEFKCVSAILLATTPPGKRYTNANTFLFVNPNARNKIYVKDFFGIVYWKANKEGYYSPYRKGKSLTNNRNIALT